MEASSPACNFPPLGCSSRNSSARLIGAASVRTMFLSNSPPISCANDFKASRCSGVAFSSTIRTAFAGNGFED